eukprot:749518-Hanusia_phi.AAC.2
MRSAEKEGGKKVSREQRKEGSREGRGEEACWREQGMNSPPRFARVPPALLDFLQGQWHSHAHAGGTWTLQSAR